MKKISVVIPCYKSEHTITGVVEETIDVLKDLGSLEIILVCDASPDNVWQVIQSLVSKYKTIVKGICFAKNFGQHSATLAGLRHVRGDVVVQMDDDGQTDPKGIPALIEKLEEGYDVVYAKYPEKKENLFRRFGSAVNAKMCVSLLGMPKHISATSFCVYRRFVVDEIVRYNRPYPYLGGLVFRTTSNIGNVEVVHKERAEGKSGYSIRKLLSLWVNGFTAFSVKPLRVGVYCGSLIAIAGFVYALIVIIRKLLGFGVLAGWSSLICLLLILGGFNLIMLGLVGEYIGRIYISINNAPQYVVKETCNIEEEQDDWKHEE